MSYNNTTGFFATYRTKIERSGEKPSLKLFERIRHCFGMMLIFVFSLFLPLFGFFIYIIWRNDRPKDAKWPLIGVVIGMIINLALEVLKYVAQWY